jgi:hypothetical protein
LLTVIFLILEVIHDRDISGGVVKVVDFKPLACHYLRFITHKVISDFFMGGSYPSSLWNVT